MYVARVPNRNSPPAYLLREGYREDGKVKSRTLANLSHWPLVKIDRLRRVLRDEVLSGAEEGVTMLRSLPHGHVAAVLGAARKIGLDRLLAAGRAPGRLVALVLAMILARVIDPASKLATSRQLDAATATSSLVRCSNWRRSASRNSMPRSTGCSASNPASSVVSPNAI
jgi:hypothetical protein